MEGKIKQLSKFSEDALNVAIKSMPESERLHFERGLTLLEKTLGVKEKKQPQSSTKLNDDAIFRNSIIPLIERRVKEIEQKELQQKKYTIKVKFDFKTNFDGLTETQLQEAHVNVVALETGLKSMTLLAQFSRGMLYISLSRMAKTTRQNWKEYVSSELGVSTMTTLRYMTLSSIIANYPRLILCDLSFTQILKHKNRLLKYLKNEEGRDLESALSLSIDIQAQDRAVLIHRTMLDIPSTKFPTDPDYNYRDAMSKEDVSEVFTQGATASTENEEGDLMEALDLCQIKIE